MASSSSVVLRMLRPTGNPTFLNTNSSESPLGPSAVLNMFPKSVCMMNTARRIPKSVSMLQAWKIPSKRGHPLVLSEEDFNNGISVDIDSGSDEDDGEVLHSSVVEVKEHITSLRREAGLPVDRYEVEEALHLKVKFPGETKGNVRVNFVKDTLIIRVLDHEIKKTSYIREVTGLAIDKYKVEETKAKMMKNGVLKLVVPKKKKDSVVKVLY